MRKCVTGAAALAVIVIAGLTEEAAAGKKYDKTIEQAAIAIVSTKLGDLRGTHRIDEPHALYPPIEARSAAQGTLEPTPNWRPAPRPNGFKAILTAFE